FLDEGVHQAGNFLKFANQVTAKVNNVGVDIAIGTAATEGLLETPSHGGRGVGGPVLGVAGVIVENAADGARFNHFLGLGDGGDAAVIVADHVDDPGL